jgi:hypothetical protein
MADTERLVQELLDLSQKSQDGDLQSAKKITKLIDSVNGNLIAESNQYPTWLLLVVTFMSGELVQIAKIKPFRSLYKESVEMRELYGSLIKYEGLFIQETITHKCPG